MQTVRSLPPLLLVIALAAGCRLFPQPMISPYSGRPQEGLSLEEAKEVWRGRYRPINTYWCQADVVTKARRVPGRVYFLATIIHQVPDTLVVRGHFNNGAVLGFHYLQSGENVRLLLPQESKLLVGDRDDLDPSRSELGRLDPSLFIRALLAGQVLPDDLNSAGGVSWRETRRDYRLEFQREGLTYQLRLSKSGLLVRRLTLRDTKGRKIARAVFHEYDLAGQRPGAFARRESGAEPAPQPRRLELIDYRGSTKTKVTIRDVKLNHPFPDAAFQLRRPGGVKVLPLEALR
jgi:hypothetical protein